MKFAAFDVGSNTVLMLVVERVDGGLNPIGDYARITRLGRGVDAKGKLDPDSAKRTLDAIVELAGKARALGADHIAGVATAALRDASDGAAFIAQVRQLAGFELEVISGDTEAQLSYLAVKRGLVLDPAAKLLIVDVGGGSTELIRAEAGIPIETISLQIGSVRLTERYVKHDPPSSADAAELRLATDEMIKALNWNFKPSTLVGIAGTVTTIAAVAMGLNEYDAKLVHGYRMKHDEVIRTVLKFGSMPLAERKKLPGLDEGRADVIFAGGAILERIMANFHLNEVIVSDQGVRWGLAWRQLEEAADVP
ncbi:MAG TPA: Ppx/GppA phosphatase family protein [Candidatus Binataceae bacterium]|nr:Ppx/GppA phosphatase family protein [Candidatus Binataceae bacterium]